jgi:hypothetical protein
MQRKEYDIYQLDLLQVVLPPLPYQYLCGAMPSKMVNSLRVTQPLSTSLKLKPAYLTASVI